MVKMVKNKKYIILIIVLAFNFLLVKSVKANIVTDFLGGLGDAASAPIFLLLGVIVSGIAWMVGQLSTLFIYLLFAVAEYNNFIKEPIVIQGWVVIRDLSNMFFILVLLIIAFATILRMENYSMKRWLPKLLIMAVLINFSKTICGLIIDAAQVIMLFFINAYNVGGDFLGHAGLVQALGLANLFNISNYTASIGDAIFNSEVNVLGVFGTALFGLILLIIACIVVVIYAVILILRIVMLWILIILSPLAFLCMSFPAGAQYASRWWSSFSKQVIVGPAMAFFLWLALTLANSPVDIGAKVNYDASQSSSNLTTQSSNAGFNSQLLSDMGGSNNMVNYLIVVLFLCAGLMMGQEAGGAVGRVAGAGMARIQRGASLAGKGALLPVAGSKALGNFGIDKLHEKTGVDLNLPRAWKTLQTKREDKRTRRYAEGIKKAGTVMESGGVAHGLLAMTGDPGDAWDQITNWKGFKQRFFKGGEGMSDKRAELRPELDQAKFEAKFIGSSKEDRLKKVNELTNRSDRLDDDISRETDKNKKAELQRKKDGIKKNLEFARDKHGKDFSDGDVQRFNETAETKQAKFDEYIPSYSFEAKGAEAKAVAGEYDKISKIDDASELVRMLTDAIKNREKSRIKAIMRKLTADYNDNEALEALVPEAGSGYEGLQALMEGFSNKDSKYGHLYAGFDKQEAYSLGAQVAEMNKKTNHWEATAAYVMEEGEWREATHDEHVKIASTEFGKKGPRANARDSNRLALGKHVVDPKTRKKTYELTDVGKIMMQSWNNSTSIDRMMEDMTESTAKYLVPLLEDLDKQGFFTARGEKSITLPDGAEGTPILADVIKLKAGMAKDFEKQLEYVKGIHAKSK